MFWKPIYEKKCDRIGGLNIHGTHVTAINSTTNDKGCLNIHGTHVTANNY